MKGGKGLRHCLGALDGTYIRVHVPKVSKPRFRTRKGWEGSVSDSRVLRDALSRPTGLKVPTTCFNMKHASARNVIERCFGLLKKRWAMLRSPSFYLIKTQYKIIVACSLLHNIIRREMTVDPLEHEAEGWRDKSFPLDERLANIFGKDRTTGKTIYTPESLEAVLEEDDNFGQILVMQKFMQKPKIAEIFNAQQNEEQKLQLVTSLLSGAFDV
ncbi:hypothetical protein Ddye_022940 [Dipteronia dyeriana]|uniref:DDE Tnp4 domain-containing protein n=1 Tax=Dipteronia dyeriana TaxID=168575 RepID=A0AAD9WSV5_9ROSI|nr:hypothetical protein Ddye_022940 [Dipteronia dyeriana]